MGIVSVESIIEGLQSKNVVLEEGFSEEELGKLRRKFAFYFPTLSYILDCGRPISREEVTLLKEKFRSYFPHLARLLP